MNYFDVKGFESSSSLKAFEERLTGRKLVNVSKERQAEIFAEGTLLDYMITEPDKVNYKRLSYQDNTGEYFFARQRFEEIQIMVEAFNNDPLCSTFSKSCQGQKEFYRTLNLEYKGYSFKQKLKGKLDLYSMFWAADIKSTAATSQNQFNNTIELFKQYRQASIYIDLAKVKGLVFLGVSKKVSKFQKPKVFKYIVEPTKEIDTLGFYEKGKSEYQYLSFFKKMMLL